MSLKALDGIFALLLGVLGLIPVLALAQAWPAKPIRMIVPFPPGGSVDTVARLIAPRMSESLGQSVVIDNRPGASSNIGMELAARSRGDGYTLLANTVPVVANPSLFPKLPFQPEKDFAPISLVVTGPVIILVHPSVPARDVKQLSRLQFILGVKVSASRRVLGNYTKGAGHFKDKGEFGIYVGNAMLMFQVFDLEHGLLGRVREYWNRYLLHDELPIGVVSGPANALPREWQRAWRACYAGDERLMSIYKSAFEQFGAACQFSQNGGQVEKIIACLKHALKLDGIIASDLVAEGTRALDADERREFADRYTRIKQHLAATTDPVWISRT